MQTPPNFLEAIRPHLAGALRRVRRNRGQTVGAVALLLAVALIPLSGGWAGAAYPEPALPVAQPSGDGQGSEAGDLAKALGDVEPGRLQEAIYRLAFALQPTKTPTPTPTPTPTATPASTHTPPPAPTAMPTPVPQQQAAAAPAAAPPATAPDASPPAGCPTAAMSGFASSLFSAINSERTQSGMPALAAHGCATYVAQLRASDMASRNYFSHTSPEGSTAFSLMDQYGVPYHSAGENLAFNTYPENETLAIAVRDLMGSPAHRENMLNGGWTHLGVGSAVGGNDTKYYVMVFIRVQ